MKPLSAERIRLELGHRVLMVGSRLALAKRDELSRVTIGEGLPYDHVQLAVTLRGFSPVAIEKALTFPKPLTKTVYVPPKIR